MWLTRQTGTHLRDPADIRASFHETVIDCVLQRRFPVDVGTQHGPGGDRVSVEQTLDKPP